MSKVARLMLYMMTWQRISKWLVSLGTLVLLTSPFVALAGDGRLAFGIWMLGCFSALLFPFLVAPIAFRYLIANSRLSLAPGFHLLCGLTLLLLTVLFSLALPVGAALYKPGSVPALLGVYIFIGASVYAFVVQWAVTSRSAGILMGFLPLLAIITLNLLAFEFRKLLQSEPLVLLLLAVCCALWIQGLKILSKKNSYTPPFRTPLNNTEYLWGGNGWLAQPLLARMSGAVKSPQGTLLQGFPDNWKSKLFFTLNLVLVSPLVCTLFVAALGLIRDKQGSRQLSLTAVFLLFSLITSLVTSVSCGELAARSRLLWLRAGADRKSAWTAIEKLLLSNVLILYLVTAAIALTSMLISDQTRISPWNYFLTIVSCSLLGAYFSLTARIRQWSMLLQLIIILVLGPGVAWALLQHTVPVIIMALLIALLALYFRYLAFSAFVSIDWTQVKPLQKLKIAGG